LLPYHQVLLNPFNDEWHATSMQPTQYAIS
jgi:hypothetical protein